MKILFVSAYYDPDLHGGAEIALRNLAGGLAARGHEIAIVCTAADGPLRAETRGNVRVWRGGIPNRYWPADNVARSPWSRGLWHLRDSYNPRGGRIVGEVIREFRPDVVCSEILAGLSIAAWDAAHALDVPVVHVLNDLYLLAPSHAAFERRWQRPLARLFRIRHRERSAQVAAVVALSAGVLARHHDAGLFDGVRTVVIPTALCIAEPVPAQPSAPGAPLRIGFLGRLTASKGIELLLAAFASMPALNAELFVGGDGVRTYVDRLHRRYADARIHFLGRVPLAALYRQVDVSVMPSLQFDTLPNVVIESSAHHVPVIGARVGGIPDLIREGENGFVMDLKTRADMRRALTFMVDHRHELAAMRATARGAIRPLLDRESQLARYEALFAEVIASIPVATATGA